MEAHFHAKVNDGKDVKDVKTYYENERDGDEHCEHCEHDTETWWFEASWKMPVFFRALRLLRQSGKGKDDGQFGENGNQNLTETT